MKKLVFILAVLVCLYCLKSILVLGNKDFQKYSYNDEIVISTIADELSNGNWALLLQLKPKTNQFTRVLVSLFVLPFSYILGSNFLSIKLGFIHYSAIIMIAGYILAVYLSGMTGGIIFGVFYILFATVWVSDYIPVSSNFLMFNNIGFAASIFPILCLLSVYKWQNWFLSGLFLGLGLSCSSLNLFSLPFVVIAMFLRGFLRGYRKGWVCYSILGLVVGLVPLIFFWIKGGNPFFVDGAPLNRYFILNLDFFLGNLKRTVMVKMFYLQDAMLVDDMRGYREAYLIPPTLRSIIYYILSIAAFIYTMFSLYRFFTSKKNDKKTPVDTKEKIGILMILMLYITAFICVFCLVLNPKLEYLTYLFPFLFLICSFALKDCLERLTHVFSWKPRMVNCCLILFLSMFLILDMSWRAGNFSKQQIVSHYKHNYSDSEELIGDGSL